MQAPITFLMREKKFTIDPGDKVMVSMRGIEFLPQDENKRPLKKKKYIHWRQSVKIGPGDWQVMMDKFKVIREHKLFIIYQL